MFGAKPLSVLTVLIAGTILAPIILTSAGLIPALQFTRERIVVTIRPEAIDVNGVYVYSNPWPKPWTQGLLVPFPVDASHPAPATVSVVELDPRSGAEVRTIPVLWIWSGPL